MMRPLSVVAVLAVAACSRHAAVVHVPAPSAGSEALLSRTGGLAGRQESIRLWLDGSGVAQGEYSDGRSDRRESIQLDPARLRAALRTADSLVRVAPPADSATPTSGCFDDFVTTIVVREGGGAERRAAAPLCSAAVRGQAYRYRTAVDALFTGLAGAPRRGARPDSSST